MAVILKVRKHKNAPFIRVFSNYGWKVRNADNSAWVQMHPGNTKMRNADNSGWLNVR